MISPEGLKSCPFCGGEAELVKDMGSIHARCTECLATSPKYYANTDYSARDRVIWEWNRRLSENETATLDVCEIIKKYLRDNGFTGLFNDNCGCYVDDLMACCGGDETCKAGYMNDCRTCVEQDECSMYNSENDFVCTSIKCWVEDKEDSDEQ